MTAANNPHIFFLVSSMQGGGAERVAALLCNHWVACGYTVTLMPTFSGRGKCIYPLDERVRLEYLADRVGRTGKSRVNMLRRFFALRKAIRDSGASVVIAFLNQVNIAALLASRGLNIPVVVSERNYPPASTIGPVWRGLRKITYPWADSVVFQTAEGLAWCRYHCRRAHTTTIANPVVYPLPTGQPVVAPSSRLNPDRRIIIAAGALTAQKNFGALLDAFSGLAGRYDDWDLVLVGDGPQRSWLEQKATLLGLDGRVHMPGRVGNMADWYRRADIFAMSSRYEGFPNVLIEAMAHGLPAVSLDCHTGPRDIIRLNIDGLLVDYTHGSAGLRGALDQLMADPAERVRLGARASEVRTRFSMARIGAAWSKALNLPG